MRGSSDIPSRTWVWRGSQSLGFRTSAVPFLLIAALGPLALLQALADGCFVFKWNKAIDINEPTQKAIIVHDAGREDLLLQVKYEGPLKEFGWLIPVPSLPKVEKGSMEAFYELSQLTQRQFGRHSGDRTLGMASRKGEEETVKVVEIKTVGAYEVAILSAKDAGSLARWLQAHDYSLPDGKYEIVEDYIRRGWYFVAAKIQLDKVVSIKAASGARPKAPTTPSKAGKVVKSQLASGELHPLIISFDTPKCIFPLKISAVGGTSSEVSVYVLSAEPLLNKFIFNKGCEKLEQGYAEWKSQQLQRTNSRETSMQNLRSIQLAWMMYAQNSTNHPAAGRGRHRNWSMEDLSALAKEGQPPTDRESLGETFYAWLGEMLQQMPVKPGQISQCTRTLPRLKGRDWHLTKHVWTFAPTEMHDLEFEPAIPALARLLPGAIGGIAAELLAKLGTAARPYLVGACKSPNPTERVNAVTGLERVHSQDWFESLYALLSDEAPEVRLHSVRAASVNWDNRLASPIVALLRDPNLEIRQEATGCLSQRERTERTPVYLSLLQDPDPNVRMHSLAIASGINRSAPPDEVFNAALNALRDSNEDVQRSALYVLAKGGRRAVPKADLLPLLNSTQSDTVLLAANFLRWGGRIRSVGKTAEPASRFTSAEAAPLMTNKFGNVRLRGLLVMQEIADATAVELTLPLLRDTNSVVRSCAFSTLQAMSGKKVSDDDPAKWEAWWAASKASFTPHQPAQ